jgi:hypothetical protein
MSQTPRMVKSTLSKDPVWYVVTSYRIKEGVDAETGERRQYLVANRKHDVTDQMLKILAEEKP